MTIVISLVIVFFSVVIHEVAHGYVAYRLGDPTARDAKRITLNPLAHIDPFGTIILPLILAFSGGPVLAWAKPVPFNPGYFRDPKRGIMLVGAADPLANLALAGTFALLFRLFSADSLPASVLALACWINVLLAIFNLIPIPPLDGSRVVTGFLPSRYVRGYLSIEPYGFIVIFGLLWLGLLREVIAPIAGVVVDMLL